MNKHIKKLFLITLCFVLLSSCKTVIKSHTADYDVMYITKQGIKQRPLVTDLEVGKTKITFTKTYVNVSITEAKENALGDFIQQQNCDLAVQPFFETSSVTENEKTSITVTLMAYPAFYRNIRNFEQRDTSAFLLQTYSSIQSIPVIAPAYSEPKSTGSSSAETSIIQKLNSGNGVKFGLSAIYAMPMGDFSDYYKSGFGFGANILIPVSKQADFTMRATYTGFSGKEIYYRTVNSTSCISTKLGVRYSTPINVYVEPQLGYSLFLSGIDDNGISYALGAGYNLTKKIEVGVLYDHSSLGSSSFNYLGLKAGFYF